DMNHYESDQVTRQKDYLAIQAILKLAPEELAEVISTHGVTMCGYAPTMAVLHAARALGASAARLVRYATSGDVSGDRDRVVGYAGLIISYHCHSGRQGQ
ncbi:MAG: AmmeMemoRadiSam system protein B, partial [Deinococcus sp.]|nr:AmmeMemoRadiSam system protein B [Deinococcus sp.]